MSTCDRESPFECRSGDDTLQIHLGILIPAACVTAASTRRSRQPFVADTLRPSRLLMVVSPCLSFQKKLDILSKSGRMLISSDAHVMIIAFYDIRPSDVSRRRSCLCFLVCCESCSHLTNVLHNRPFRSELGLTKQELHISRLWEDVHPV